MEKNKEKKRYPRDFSNKELQEKIDYYGDLDVGQYKKGPSNFTKANLGLTELQRRGNDKYTIIVLLLITLSIIAAGFSVYHVIKDSNDDKIWKQEQINLLKSINKNTSK